jgi:hypothetical protein
MLYALIKYEEKNKKLLQQEIQDMINDEVVINANHFYFDVKKIEV